MNKFIIIIINLFFVHLIYFGCSESPLISKDINWVKINKGSFVFGSPEDISFRSATREKEVNVILTHDFVMASTEVTQYQWLQAETAMPDQLWYGDNLPVTFVNFYELLKFCNDLSKKEGYDSCYDLSSCKGVYGASCPEHETPSNLKGCGCGTFNPPKYTYDCSKDPVIYTCKDKLIHKYKNWYECPGYRLPTTAEWEYAAKAGTTTHTYGGDIIGAGMSACDEEKSLNDIAWYCYNSDDRTHPVAQKKPNAFGLYDMLGNVAEIVDYFTDGGSLDYMDGHSGSDLTDPQGQITGSWKDNRGGYFNGIGEITRSSWQMSSSADEKQSLLGFRIVRTLFKGDKK